MCVSTSSVFHGNTSCACVATTHGRSAERWIKMNLKREVVIQFWLWRAWLCYENFLLMWQHFCACDFCHMFYILCYLYLFSNYWFYWWGHTFKCRNVLKLQSNTNSLLGSTCLQCKQEVRAAVKASTFLAQQLFEETSHRFKWISSLL